MTAYHETEKDVKRKIKKLLDEHSWFWWMPAGTTFSTGISDFNCLKDGVFMAIEAKYGSNKPTALQRAYLETVASHSAFAFVVSDKNLPFLSGFLDAFDRATAAQRRETKPTPEDGSLMLNAIAAMTKDWQGK